MSENKKEGVKEERTNEALSISGFILGILSILFLGAKGMIIGIVGVVFSGYAYKKKKTKIGKTGIILNIIGIVLGLLLLILVMIFAEQIYSQMGMNPAV
ncbi:MAG: hypothetical protein ACOC1P_02920 [Minisyncoccales bacterium]